MKPFKSWKTLVRKKNTSDGGKCGMKMTQLPFIAMAAVCIVMLFIVYKTTNYQYRHAQIEEKFLPFDSVEEPDVDFRKLYNLPRGIIQPKSDMELKPLWSRSKVDVVSHKNLLAMPVGINQKHNVDIVVQKFLAENFAVMLFHYDANLEGWWDLDWCGKAVHIVAQNQTKWWFAKRFLHPAVISIYDYIFLWDEDLGVENFNPRRYLRIVRSEGLEISQPALHPNSTGIHHRITVRSRSKIFHRRVYDNRGSTRCTNTSEGPPCTGFVEGMAPVFSRSAWYCAWHLIQNDLVHGWGMDMKLGYCAQGDRTRNVGIVDSEYVFHQGIRTLGGGGPPRENGKREKAIPGDPRVEIRRQSVWELQIFKKRWSKAMEEDKTWVDPFSGKGPELFRRKRKRVHHSNLRT
ncbi:hypothetical protein ACFE04_002640 [Oxalis oulophora]